MYNCIILFFSEELNDAIKDTILNELQEERAEKVFILVLFRSICFLINIFSD